MGVEYWVWGVGYRVVRCVVWDVWCGMWDEVYGGVGCGGVGVGLGAWGLGFRV